MKLSKKNFLFFCSFFSKRKCVAISHDLIVFNNKNNIFVYSIENSKIILEIELKNISNLICDSNQNFSVIEKNKNILIFNIENKKNQLKEKIETEIKILSHEFNAEGEIVYFNSNFQFFKLSNKKQKKVEEKEKEEKLIKKNVFQQEIEITKKDNSLFAYDPDLGNGSWKSLFKGPTHALTTTSNLYNSFMDGFLLKSTKNELNQEKEKEIHFIPNTQKSEEEKKKKKKFEKETKELFSKIASKME